MVVANHQFTSEDRLALLKFDDMPQPDITERPRYYEIHDVRRSENALLLFNNKYVFKILLSYKDHRYSQITLEERQACLIEGMEWNRDYTYGIHLGLARYCRSEWQSGKIFSLGIGEVWKYPSIDQLDPGAEYVLMMRKLPKNYRLDCRLKEGINFFCKNYEPVLTQFLWHIHTNPLSLAVSSRGVNNWWGSIPQLLEKFTNNLKTVEQPRGVDEAIKQTEEYRLLFSTCKTLREMLLPMFSQDKYRKYFEERIERKQIKRCHGDLKARNIWIMPPSQQADMGAWNRVRALDAVDFNPDYCHIDTLSDFAMLVADIYARTYSQDIVDHMTKKYLNRTNQEDLVSRFVLNYYLVEKAFVGAFVSIMYDNAPGLGRAYLYTTHKYLEELKRLMAYR